MAWFSLRLVLSKLRVSCRENSLCRALLFYTREGRNGGHNILGPAALE